MQIHPAPQGSRAWLYARLGIPTASNFHRLLTPAQLKPSKSADAYLNTLLAEWALGRPMDDQTSAFMERGHELEEQAARWYSFQNDLEVEEVGLCLTDDGLVGASPDRLVGDDGLLEIKCLSAPEHIAALMGEKDGDHRIQVQGQLLVTGRVWSDLLFFNPVLPSVVVRHERDEAVQAALSEALPLFTKRLSYWKKILSDKGVEPPPPPEDEVDPSEPTEEQKAAFEAYLAGQRAEPAETRRGPDLSDPNNFPF